MNETPKKRRSQLHNTVPKHLHNLSRCEEWLCLSVVVEQMLGDGRNSNR